MSDPTADGLPLACPTPRSDHETIQLAHGGGGRLMRRLIEQVFQPAFSATLPGDSEPAPLHDSVTLPASPSRLAFTTDSFVVSPLFFPGGDIGKLAVYGTVNDLAMSGAVPRYLSAGFIIEEGLPLETLRRVVDSMSQAAASAGVQVVTGDTKVVDRGKADGLFINTAGIGFVPHGLDVSPARVRPGDVLLVSGDLGRHGLAIMSVREGLQFETDLQSDCGSLASLVGDLATLGPDLHCLRDLTRGGLAAAVNEIAADAGVAIGLTEADIPVSQPVRAACELLGLDPLYAANEGTLLAVVAPHAAHRALEVMRGTSAASTPAVVGKIAAQPAGAVVLRSSLGGDRVLDLLSGEQMPRIC
jgi:hydrogenase expression/formation protein HypE